MVTVIEATKLGLPAIIRRLVERGAQDVDALNMVCVH